MHRAREKGQTLPIVAIVMVVLLGAAGFAVDTGYHQYQQRAQQTATDSAALAAAADLAAGTSDASGKADAASNGYTSGSNGVTVNVGAPATGDPFAGNAQAVQVTISVDHPTFFERVFNINKVTVTTNAVAIANADSQICMIALQTSGNSKMSGNATINAPNCDVAINSSHFVVGGQSVIDTHDAIQYSGSITGQSSATFQPGVPVPALPVADPCMQITACAYLRANPPPTTPCSTAPKTGSIPSGTYCSFDLQGNVTLTGQYVITGDFKANNANISGTNVTIAVMSSSGNFNSNNATFNISAPTSGNEAGMLWYVPNYTGNINMNAGDGGMTGMLYMPQANVTMNAGAKAYFAIIAGQLSFNASNTTFSNPSGSPYATKPRLVE